MPWRLRRESFVMRVAYGWSGKVPKQISLCRLFWRFWLMLLVWPFIWLSTGFLLTMIVGAGLLVAQLPSFLSARGRRERAAGGDKERNETVPMYYPIERWPTVRGHRVWPITVILGGLAPVIALPFLRFLVWCVVAIGGGFWQALHEPVVWAVFAVVMLVGLVSGAIDLAARGFRRGTNSSVVRLMVERAKAAKQKVCPIIEIVTPTPPQLEPQPYDE